MLEYYMLRKNKGECIKNGSSEKHSISNIFNSLYSTNNSSNYANKG